MVCKKPSRKRHLTPEYVFRWFVKNHQELSRRRHPKSFLTLIEGVNPHKVLQKRIIWSEGTTAVDWFRHIRYPRVSQPGPRASQPGQKARPKTIESRKSNPFFNLCYPILSVGALYLVVKQKLFLTENKFYSFMVITFIIW